MVGRNILIFKRRGGASEVNAGKMVESLKWRWRFSLRDRHKRIGWNFSTVAAFFIPPLTSTISRCARNVGVEVEEEEKSHKFHLVNVTCDPSWLFSACIRIRGKCFCLLHPAFSTRFMGAQWMNIFSVREEKRRAKRKECFWPPHLPSALAHSLIRKGLFRDSPSAPSHPFLLPLIHTNKT